MAMDFIDSVGFLECSNGRSCKLHLIGCGNSLVFNQDGWGVDVRLRLHMTNLVDELACYSIGSDGSDGCHVGFTARENAARGNGLRLDGAAIEIVSVFTPDSKNRSMHCLYHHNR
jgi:hypothetical protein